MLTSGFPVAAAAAGIVEKPASYRYFLHFRGSNIGNLSIAALAKDLGRVRVVPEPASGWLYSITSSRFAPATCEVFSI